VLTIEPVKKLSQFVRAVTGDWIATMSGGVGLLLGFAAKFWSDNVVPDLWMWTACIACVFVAFFRVWSQEFDRAEAALHRADAVKLSEAVMTLQSEVATLRSRVALAERRRISPDQRGVIRSRLRPLIEQWRAAGHQFQVFVAPFPSADDAMTYGRDFADALEEAGFFVFRDSWNALRLRMNDDYSHGVWLRRDAKKFAGEGWPRFDEALFAALREPGIAVTLQDHDAAETLDLIIGARDLCRPNVSRVQLRAATPSEPQSGTAAAAI
jgi:hypothetical protein